MRRLACWLRRHDWRTVGHILIERPIPGAPERVTPRRTPVYEVLRCRRCDAWWPDNPIVKPSPPWFGPALDRTTRRGL